MINAEEAQKLMPKGLSREEKYLERQMKKMERHIIWRAKHNFSNYLCYICDYPDKVYQCLREQNFNVECYRKEGIITISWRKENMKNIIGDKDNETQKYI